MRASAANRLFVIGLQLAIVIVVVGIWEGGTGIVVGPNRFAVDPFIWSRPSKIMARVGDWLQSGIILNDVVITLYQGLMSFVLGALVGIVVGCLLGRSDLWSRVLNPFIQVINALPRLVFAPIFFLLFGLGENSKIALGFSLVFFIVFFNAYQGVREVDRNVFNNARMLGANERQMTWHVLLPSALTWILTSLHTSVGFAMVGAVVGEYLGASRGLGHVISQSEGNLDATGVWAGMLVLCIVVVGVEILVTRLEGRLVRWKPQVAGEVLAG